MKQIALDKYARDTRAWKELAEVNYLACRTLFIHAIEHPTLYFTAVTLAHISLEMFLKAALISSGMVIFDSKQMKFLEPSITLRPSDCAWGHNLVSLAKQLAQKRSDFDLSENMDIQCGVLETPVTVEQGFAIFDPFFSELRYPRELKNIAGFGGAEWDLLEELVYRLDSFISV